MSTVATSGAFVVSLDFELVWGVRDLEIAGEGKNLMPTRVVVPRLLELFRKYEIHATWATVGFLFFETREDLLKSLPELKPNYKNIHLSPYKTINEEIGLNEGNDPLHYAPSLIQMIVKTPYQELGTHTFSHYYCLEDGQTEKDFQADLRAAISAGKRYGCEIRSIVFPRNQYSQEILNVCAANGIKTYRGNENLWFRAPSKRSEHRRLSRRVMRIMDAYLDVTGANSYQVPKASDPVNVPASRYLRPIARRFKIFEPLRLRRIKSSMHKAARAGEIFHLWWHPEDFANDVEGNIKFLEQILMEFSKLRSLYGMQSLNMQEVGELARSAKLGDA